MTDYRRWLLAQLKFVETIDKHPEPQSHHFDELRNLITEAGQRASVAGLPVAVQACETRQGPISPDIARKILAICLGTIEPASDLLSVAQAASRLQVRPRVIYEACAAGQLRHRRVGRQIRITPTDADRFSTVSFSSQSDDDRHSRR